MAAVTYSAPILAGTTLPDPSSIQVRERFVGGAEEMWDGKVVVDIVNPNPKRTFTYRWNYTDTYSDIQAGWVALKSLSGSLVHVDGNTYTVSRPVSQNGLTYDIERTAAGLVWINVTLVLQEV